MTTYIFLYFITVFFALSMGKNRSIGLWVIVGILFVIIIGWRDYVGGDWFNYLLRFEETSYLTYSEVLDEEDPGYYLLNLWMYTHGFEIYAVNFISAIIFTIGLIRLSRQQFNPWLAMAVAVPYLVIVVAMGYTRQGVAIGFIMWAIAALDEKRFIQFLILVSLAATFHKSAVMMVGIGMFEQGRGRLFRMMAIGFVGFGIYEAFLAEHQEKLWESYVDEQMESQGAQIRVFMNLIPALVLFLFKSEWEKQYDDYEFWRALALGAVASVFIVGMASTAVDRMALYMIPLQLVVFARLPLLAQHRTSSQVVTLSILLYYAAVLLVWLNFAANARSWIPYHNMLFLGV